MAEGDAFGPDRYWDDGVHVKRYLESIEWLRPWIGNTSRMCGEPHTNRKLLEVGGCGVWTRMLQEAMPWVQVAPTDGDIRKGWASDPMYDAVAFMEVMEHLWDVPPAADGRWPDEFTGNSVRTVLRSIFESLKPGGVMLLTTPNAASCNAIWKAVHGHAANTYRPHFREYSCGEVQEFVWAAGFRILRHETLEIWGNWGPPGQYEKMRGMLRDLGVTSEMRGEDQFMIAQKPVDA